nr:MAG TPA: holin family protein [Caudoviricetes sp.]
MEYFALGSLSIVLALFIWLIFYIGSPTKKDRD